MESRGKEAEGEEGEKEEGGGGGEICDASLGAPLLQYKGTWSVGTGVRRGCRDGGGGSRHIVSVAPMMNWTNKHFRCLARMLTSQAVLYTEMVVASTVIHNSSFLRWDPARECYPNAVSPQDCQQSRGGARGVVLQLGGNDPEQLKQAATIAVNEFGYSEINLNVGCPSKKVAGKGCFGAALMREPHRVAELCRALHAGAGDDVPITVKCRIGVDDQDSYEFLRDFVAIVASDGIVRHFIIHARKALLNGVSTSGNRSIPPLKYEYVCRLIEDFPCLQFTINGGIGSLSLAKKLIDSGCHGVMIGRAAYRSSWILAGVDEFIRQNRYDDRRSVELVKGEQKVRQPTRKTVLRSYMKYADSYFLKAFSRLSNHRRDGICDRALGDEREEGLDRSVIHPANENMNKVWQDLLHPLLGLVSGISSKKKFARMLEEATVGVRRLLKDNIGDEDYPPLPSQFITMAMACIDNENLEETYSERHDAIFEEARIQQMKENEVARYKHAIKVRNSYSHLAGNTRHVDDIEKQSNESAYDPIVTNTTVSPGMTCI